jgi:hypothetical protein
VSGRRRGALLLFLVLVAVAGALLARRLTASDPVDPPSGVELRLADLGGGWQLASSRPGGFQPLWPWAQDGVCPAYRAGDYPSQQHRTHAQDLRYTESGGDGIREVVEEFAPGWAEKSVADVRQVIKTCGSYPGPGGQVEFRIVATDLAGPGSLLVWGAIGGGSTEYFLVCLDGSVVGTVEIPGKLGEDYARKLAAALKAHH